MPQIKKLIASQEKARKKLSLQDTTKMDPQQDASVETYRTFKVKETQEANWAFGVFDIFWHRFPGPGNVPCWKACPSEFPSCSLQCYVGITRGLEPQSHCKTEDLSPRQLSKWEVCGMHLVPLNINSVVVLGSLAQRKEKEGGSQLHLRIHFFLQK